MALRINIFAIISIVILGGLLYFYRLDSVPPGFNWDEVSHSYNAYSILKTGRDEWGEYLSLANIRAYGDYPLPLYMYLSIPTIFVFGLSEITMRSTSAIFGLLLVVLTFGLSNIFIKDKRVVFISTLIALISPWTIMISRQVLRATPAIFFLGLGVFLYIRYFKKNIWFFNLGLISLGLSAYGYHNTRILAPIIVFLLFIFSFCEIIKIKSYLASVSIWGLIFFIPLPLIILSPTGSARSQFVGILDQGAINNINQSRGESSLTEPLKRAVYNKATYFIEVSLKNYLGYFSPQYLGFHGGTQYQYSIPHLGLLPPPTLVFFYVGLLYLILNFRRINKWQRFLLFWILISPIPAAVTRDPYQVIRSTTMLPAIFLVLGIGIDRVVNLLGDYSKKLVNIFVGVLLLLSVLFTSYYLSILFGSYSKDYSFAWQYGYRDALSYVNQNIDTYNNIIVTKRYGEPHEFVLFYTKYDPSTYQKDASSKRYFQNGWYLVDNFGKYKFIDDEKIIDQTQGLENSLLVTTPDNYPKNSQLLKSIYFLNGRKAFDIVKLP